MKPIFWIRLSCMFIGLSLSSGTAMASDIIRLSPTKGNIVVSGDGSVVAGSISHMDRHGVFQWTRENGIEIVDKNYRNTVIDINFNGSVMVGHRFDEEGKMFSYSHAFRWTLLDGLSYLDCEPYQYCNDITAGLWADGALIVRSPPEYGMSGEMDNFRDSGLVFWKGSGDIAVYGMVPDSSSTEGVAVSEDGTTVVGNTYLKRKFDNFFFKWTENGAFELLGIGRARDISADGKVIVGRIRAGQAFRHTELDGIEEIGDFDPNRVNGDGSLIVGGDVIWDEDNGPLSIEAYLASKGIDVESDNWRFRRASDVSTDGSVIVGLGGTDTAPDTEVVDNLEPGFTVGWEDMDASQPHNWSRSNCTPGGYNGDYHYAPPGDGRQIATWTFKAASGYRPLDRPLEIFARWTSGANRAKNAAYTIYGYDYYFNEIELSTVHVDQTKNGGKFNSLGVFRHENPTKVVLRDNASGHVIADAVELVFLDYGWVATIDARPKAPDNLRPTPP